MLKIPYRCIYAYVYIYKKIIIITDEIKLTIVYAIERFSIN